MKLKNSMKKTVFKDFSFSDERKNAVKEAIRSNQSQQQYNTWKAETIMAVLGSVQQQPMQGYDISIQLFQKGELIFQNNEGQLYTLLHLLENKEILTSSWSDNKKHYALTPKGKKYLAAYKQDNSHQPVSLKHLLEEASLWAQQNLKNF
ncbi:PadR family transcriptional regulator [Gracilibacillus oryzae]|nr:PadR family transcriptional regulator [Gracilibacillus oryzae]